MEICLNILEFEAVFAILLPDEEIGMKAHVLIIVDWELCELDKMFQKY